MREEAVGGRRGNAAAGDLKESFMIGRLDVPANDPYYHCAAAGKHFAPNLWPAKPAALKPLYIAYYRAMESLALDLIRCFARALNLPAHFFDHKADPTISTLAG